MNVRLNLTRFIYHPMNARVMSDSQGGHPLANPEIQKEEEKKDQKECTYKL